MIGQKKNTPKVPREARHSNLEIRMPKKFVKPDEEGAVGYPTDPADEATLRKLGFVEEGYPKRMYRDGEEPCEVNGSEEERVLGKDWVVFDEALRKNGGFYRERFKAAVNNPAEQVRLYTEYHTLHPALAAADSWYKETAPQIPLLQSQAMFNLVSDRQAENRERRATEAEATEAPADNQPTEEALRETTESRLPKPVHEGKRCAKVIDEVKRIKTMYKSGISMEDIKKNWPNYKVWEIVEGLSKEDQGVFEKPGRWGPATGYAKLILSKFHGNSPDTITDWVKAYKKHEKSNQQKI